MPELFLRGLADLEVAHHAIDEQPPEGFVFGSRAARSERDDVVIRRRQIDDEDG